MTHSSEPGAGGIAKSVLGEACLVLAIGGLIALAANFLSPRGLSLTRDYFPEPVPTITPAANASANPAADPSVERLKARGLRVADIELARRLFRDPRRDQELIVFVDARDEAHYAAGHLPAAYPFDRYRVENDLPALLPVCLTAETIVIYCTGGNCEDSEFAALALRDAGVPNEKIVVYPGGLAEWQRQRLPVETGARNSGNLTNSQ